MSGKMILPLLGGSASVWNTCLVFFQGALLVGYLYAHLQSKIRFVPQFLIHLGSLICFAAFLPIGLPSGWAPPTETNPVPWLLALLLVSLGLPFMLLSGTSPLLQSWYSASHEPDSNDPYFLYAAGNAGSLVGLLGYPFLLEPYLRLSWQSHAWSIGYIVLVFCTVVVGCLLLRQGQVNVAAGGTVSPAPTNWVRFKWVALAAIPSSLLQSVTSFITIDLAPVPLLWVLPLGVYLLTFILVFSRHELISKRITAEIQPVALIALALVAFWPGVWDLYFGVLAGLLALFFTGMSLHGELARSRPPADRLTEFFMFLALGGVAGGIISAIIAPILFNRFLEFPVMLILAAMVATSGREKPSDAAFGLSDILWPLSIVIVGALLLIANHLSWFRFTWSNWAFEKAFGVALAAAVFICHLRWNARFGFGLGLAAYMLVGFGAGYVNNSAVYVERNFNGFFGIHLDQGKNLMMLTHGNTSHGSQFTDLQSRRIPTSYYYSGGPLGDLFKNLGSSPNGRSVAVIGLGTGAMATYASPQDHWIFYELNPGIARVAQNSDFFSYLPDCPAKVDVVLGDGRLSISKAPENYFDVIVLDAFSSDSVPVHLLTREALTMYQSKLGHNGAIVMHITNRYLDLSGVVGAAAGSLGYRGLIKDHTPNDKAGIIYDADPSTWAVVSRNEIFLSKLTDDGWMPLSGDPSFPSWSDDYSSLFPYLKMLQGTKLFRAKTSPLDDSGDSSDNR